MFQKSRVRRILTGVLAATFMSSLMTIGAFAVNQVDVDIRVFDQSTGRIIENVANVSVPAVEGSGYVQSESYEVPDLDSLTDVEFGRVEKITGNYYFPVGTVSEGTQTWWSTNNRNGTLTYYVSSWQPGTGAGTGSNGSVNESIGTGGSKYWTQTVVYHSNYPNGTDYTQTYTYDVRSYTDLYSTYNVLTLDQLGFSEPDGYRQAQTSDGSEWSRWNTKKDRTGERVTSIYALDKNNPTVHLYAQWVPENSVEKDPVTLTHKDGTTTYTVSEYFAGDTATTVDCKLVKPGLNFEGWDTDQSADSVVHPAGDSFVIESDETVYAVWDEEAANDTVVLSYNANGGSGAPAADDSGVEEGTEATFNVSDTVPTHPDGNKFLGWADSPDATEPEYQAGDPITSTTDKTIYAVWENDETVNKDKISEPGMDKKSDGQDAISDVAPGDVVDFTLDSNIGTDLVDAISGNAPGSYTGTYTLTFYDTMSGPMTFNADSVKVSVGGVALDNGDFTVNTNPGDGHTFTVTLDVVNLLNNGKFDIANAGKTEESAVRVAYTATVSQDAEDQDAIRNDASVNDSATDTITGEVVDEPTPPMTGSQIALLCTIGGVVLMGGSAVFFVKKKKTE